MVIYADVLICLNIFVNFLLLQVVKLTTRSKMTLHRQIFASVIGALCSLYIFAPTQPVVVELLIRLAISCLVVFCFTGRCVPAAFIKNLAVFYGVSFVYAGTMFMLWFLFQPSSMSVNNGVVYFGISPLVLIVSTVISYFLIKLINKYFVSARMQRLYPAKIYFGEKAVRVTALADTGHSLTDLFSDSAVVVLGKNQGEALFSKDIVDHLGGKDGGSPPPALASRYRLIPYKSVGSNGILPAFRCDSIEIELDKYTKTVEKPIVAINSGPLSGNYEAIVDASIVE